MRRRIRHCVCGLAVGLLIAAVTERAHGQGGLVTLADDIIVISSGQRAKERARDSTQLGPIHGAGQTAFPVIAGEDASRLGAPPPAHRPLDTLQAASREMQEGSPRDRPSSILPPALAAPPRAQPPLYGPSRAGADYEGPSEGLTLEQALALMVRDNPDLAVKFQEIPKAEADVLTASLWGNPLIFAAADGIPYGSYSQQRPGTNSYGITLVQPFDVNGKLRARTRLAQVNRSVLCAQYQDAVRLEAENLHAAFIDVLAARTNVEYLRESIASFEALLKTNRRLFEEGEAFHSDLDSALIQRETTAIAFDEGVTRLRQAKRTLALRLGIPASQADAIEPRGRVGEKAPFVPPLEQLVALAMANRPDLAAVRLGVRSALANAQVQRRERFPDVFALYTPYNVNSNNDNPDTSAATSWGAGLFATIPIPNRNQGNIRRADHNVRQTQLEAAGRERQVAAEVENAALELASAQAALERFERAILSRAEHRLNDYRTRFTLGRQSLDLYLNAERDYNEVLRQYRGALVRRRRATLAINTAVGLRLLP